MREPIPGVTVMRWPTNCWSTAFRLLGQMIVGWALPTRALINIGGQCPRSALINIRWAVPTHPFQGGKHENEESLFSAFFAPFCGHEVEIAALCFLSMPSCLCRKKSQKNAKMPDTIGICQTTGEFCCSTTLKGVAWRSLARIIH